MIRAFDHDSQILLLPSWLHRFADLENDVIRSQRIVDLQSVSFRVNHIYDLLTTVVYSAKIRFTGW